MSPHSAGWVYRCSGRWCDDSGH